MKAEEVSISCMFCISAQEKGRGKADLDWAAICQWSYELFVLQPITGHIQLGDHELASGD
jgi:hypothetical protein